MALNTLLLLLIIVLQCTHPLNRKRVALVLLASAALGWWITALLKS